MSGVFTFLGELLIRKYKTARPSDSTSLWPAAGGNEETHRLWQEGKTPSVFFPEVNGRSANFGVIWAVIAS